MALYEFKRLTFMTHQRSSNQSHSRRLPFTYSLASDEREHMQIDSETGFFFMRRLDDSAKVQRHKMLPSRKRGLDEQNSNWCPSETLAGFSNFCQS